MFHFVSHGYLCARRKERERDDPEHASQKGCLAWHGMAWTDFPFANHSVHFKIVHFQPTNNNGVNMCFAWTKREIPTPCRVFCSGPDTWSSAVDPDILSVDQMCTRVSFPHCRGTHFTHSPISRFCMLGHAEARKVKLVVRCKTHQARKKARGQPLRRSIFVSRLPFCWPHYVMLRCSLLLENQ